ncbi:MAG: hypothetical protein GDA39_02590 [Hyphomonadaceae bacterium]|nr:hypothetical protein [Hyphomonadaceae bacterium]MBC6411854.1 hypothetical protein [Hyphomonadaceae bacterium]
MKRDPNDVLRDVLATYADADKWCGQPFERIRRIPNTKVGDVGQDFVEALCREYGLDCTFPEKDDGTRMRQSPWDIRIEEKTFELKTASEDVSGSFQFNHIRYHREYDALLCIGIAPYRIYVGGMVKSCRCYRWSGQVGFDGERRERALQVDQKIQSTHADFGL